MIASKDTEEWGGKELDTVFVVYTWRFGGPHILITVYANKMKLCVYNAYVL